MMASFVYKMALVALAYIEERVMFFLLQNSLYFCVGQERASGQMKVLGQGGLSALFWNMQG